MGHVAVEQKEGFNPRILKRPVELCYLLKKPGTSPECNKRVSPGRINTPISAGRDVLDAEPYTDLVCSNEWKQYGLRCLVKREKEKRKAIEEFTCN
jgi:hypothetical protein